jgi:4-amino-4-deoxy-L-arabinose transferase-like glycosyltransferase
VLAPALRHPLLLCLLAAGIFFFRLGGAHLWDRDEPRNARCAQEMLERNDWVTPTFNGELRAHKPVLLYWLMMGAYQVLGIGEFSARLPSAALSVGTVLATYYLGRRLFSPGAGLWAGVALATSPLFDMSARAATPDATLIFFMTASMLTFVLAAFPARSAGPASKPHLGLGWQDQPGLRLATYALLGVALLAKGPVGLVLPLATMGAFGLASRWEPPSGGSSWIEKLRAWLQMASPHSIVATLREMHLVSGIALALLIAAPWYIAVGYATDGAFLVEFFGDHNFGRALEAKEGHRGFGPPFYLAVILAGVFPWSVLAAPLALDTYRNLCSTKSADSDRRGLLFALCWIAAYLLVFSIARTKLPSYVTPCYPAVALVIGLFVDRWWQGKLAVSLRWMLAAMAALLLVGICLTGGLAWASHKYLPSESWLAGLGLLVAAFGLAGVAAWYLQGQRFAIGALAGAAILLAVGLHGVLLVRISGHQQAAAMLRETGLADAGHSRWIAVTGMEPSWLFYANRPIIERPLFDDNRMLRIDTVRNLLLSEEPTVALVATRDVEQLQAELGENIAILDQAPLLLRRHRLVLLSSRQNVARIAAHRSGRMY